MKFYFFFLLFVAQIAFAAPPVDQYEKNLGRLSTRAAKNAYYRQLHDFITEYSKRGHIFKIGGTSVRVNFNSVIDEVADAYLTPQNRFNSGNEAVTAIIGWSAKEGLAAYNAIAAANGVQFGDAFLTVAGDKSKAKNLLHIAILSSGTVDAFSVENFGTMEKAVERLQEVVALGVYNGLKLAHSKGLQSIALPPLGTFNFHGLSLTGKTAGDAFMKGYRRFIQEIPESSIKNISIGVYPQSRFANPVLEYLSFDTALRQLVGEPEMILPTSPSLFGDTYYYLRECILKLTRRDY